MRCLPTKCLPGSEAARETFSGSVGSSSRRGKFPRTLRFLLSKYILSSLRYHWSFTSVSFEIQNYSPEYKRMLQMIYILCRRPPFDARKAALTTLDSKAIIIPRAFWPPLTPRMKIETITIRICRTVAYLYVYLTSGNTNNFLEHHRYRVSELQKKSRYAFQWYRQAS